MKLTKEMMAVCKGMTALETEIGLAQRRVDNPYTRDGQVLPDTTQKFNADTLARLQSIRSAFEILTNN